MNDTRDDTCTSVSRVVQENEIPGKQMETPGIFQVIQCFVKDFVINYHTLPVTIPCIVAYMSLNLKRFNLNLATTHLQGFSFCVFDKKAIKSTRTLHKYLLYFRCSSNIQVFIYATFLK